MKACVLNFVVAGGGSQTVTGVVDQAGVPFVPKGFYFVFGQLVNTLGWQTSGGVPTDGAARWNAGFDDLANRVAFGAETGWVSLGGQTVSNNGGWTTASLHDEQSQLFFGGFQALRGYVSAARSGEFDLTYTINTRPGQSALCFVLGGDDLSVHVGTTREVPGHPNWLNTGFQAQAALFSKWGADATGTGGGTVFLGWDTNGSNRSGATTFLTNYQGPTRQQSSTEPPIGAHVDTWDTTKIILNQQPGASGYLAVGGSGIFARAGSFTQPATPSVQQIDTDIRIRLVVLLSFGAEATGSTLTDMAALTVGMLDGTRQQAYWTAENTNALTPPNTNGARYLSDQNVLLFATPNRGSTTFSALAASQGFVNDGRSFRVNWTAVDGVARQVLWLALGETYIPTLPNGCPTGLPLQAIAGRAGCVPGIG